MSNKQKIIVGAVVGAVIVVAIGLNWSEQANDPQAQVARENASLVEKVGKLVLLPDEVPTVVTITDPAPFAEDPFLYKAQAGNIMLMYPEARRVILYDPVADRVVDIGTLNLGE